MKYFLLLLLSILPAHALIDSQIDVRPDKKYMNYFLDGYLPWFQKKFQYSPTLSDKEGDKFLREALYQLDHWKISERPELDQLLIGQGFNKDIQAFYVFRVYIKPSLRRHPYLLSRGIDFEPMFIERNTSGEICFLKPEKMEEIKWQHVPLKKDSFYLGHYCKGKNLKFISQLASLEMDFPNPFKAQSEYELRTFSSEGPEKILYFVKNTHTAMIPPFHIPFVNAHGENLLLPFDKYSVDKEKNLIIYYP